MTKAIQALVLALFVVSIPKAYAEQGSFSNSGGSGQATSGIVVNSPVANPAGPLSINCPTVSTGACAGGSLTFFSNDGTISINAAFTSGKYAEGCAGGGKGGHVTCAFSFSGYFSGTLSLNGQIQAINGFTYQEFGTGGAAATGTTAYNSAYTPFYYSDSEQIHRSDDLQGTNQISFGGQGADPGQFYGAYGIALDSAGRIYVADTYNCRVARFDDMNGTNWTTFGGICGSDVGQFYDPSGIAVDSSGKIYIMDTGNSRLVRIDDMTGANWVSFSSVGSGTGQLSQFISVTVDAAGHIYIPDAGRLVRMDDMTGANFTVLTQSPPVNGVSYSFQSPSAVALDSAGRIYVADNQAYQPAVIRVDDMNGTNWTQIYTGSGAGLNSIGVDSTGIVFTGGGGAKIIDNMAAVLNSSGNVGPIGSYYVFGVTPVPLPSPRPSAISFTPASLTFTQNVGTTGSQTLTIANFGGSPLDLGGMATSDGFGVTNNCPGQLIAGSNCTATVTFTPAAPGPASGLLMVTDDSGNAGAAQAVTLDGTGTAPAASVTPASLSFQSQVMNTTSNPRNVVLQNVGTGPMQVASVIPTGPFGQTNSCGVASIAPGASCTIQVTFTPTAVGQATGKLTITDDAGTQTVTLSGNGSAPVSLSSSSLSFGTLAVGGTSAAKTVTLTNRQSVALNFSSIAASGSFAIVSNTCLSSVAGGGNCTVGVTFSPTAIGAATGTLTFTDDAGTSPQTVSLTGTGSAPVTLSSSSLSFNTVVVGSTSTAKSVTLTNHQTMPLNFSSVATSGSFAVATNTCVGSIAGGATCTVGVTFSPTAAGSATGTLTITDDAANSPQTVSLTGTGSAPVTLSATTLSFGTVTVGTTSSSKSVTVTNHEAGALSFFSVVAGSGFAVSSDTCVGSIAAGASCTVKVTFTPTTAGAVNGTLTVTDDALNSPQTVTLSGSGR